MDIHTRIKERRLELGLSAKELAEMVGVARQTVEAWEWPEAKGGTAPTRSRIKIVAKHLKVNAEWLLTGNDANLISDGRFVYIPRYRQVDQETSLVNLGKYFEGISQLGDDETTYAYRADWMKKNGFIPAHCRVVFITDDSMALGEQLLIDITDKCIQPGKPYALDTLAGILVRRLYPRSDGMLVVRADNPDFPEEIVTADAVKIAGRVVAFAGVV